MSARRAHALHHGRSWENGETNVVFHREHRSKRGRSMRKIFGMPKAPERKGKMQQKWKKDMRERFSGYF